MTSSEDIFMLIVARWTYTVGQLPVISMLLPTQTLLARCRAGMKSIFTVPSSLFSCTTWPPASTYTQSSSWVKVLTRKNVSIDTTAGSPIVLRFGWESVHIGWFRISWMQFAQSGEALVQLCVAHSLEGRRRSCLVTTWKGSVIVIPVCNSPASRSGCKRSVLWPRIPTVPVHSPDCAWSSSSCGPSKRRSHRTTTVSNTQTLSPNVWRGFLSSGKVRLGKWSTSLKQNGIRNCYRFSCTVRAAGLPFYFSVCSKRKKWPLVVTQYQKALLHCCKLNLQKNRDKRAFKHSGHRWRQKFTIVWYIISHALVCFKNKESKRSYQFPCLFHLK